MSWWRSKEKPDFWIDYESNFSNTWSSKTAVSDLSFVVVDTETTGFDPKLDRILSIAGIPVSNGIIHANTCFHMFVSQQTYNPESAVIHGITHSTANSGETELQALQQFLAHVKDKVIVGHHIGFDRRMLNEMSKRVCGMKLKNIFIDTATLFKRTFPQNYAYYLPNSSPSVELDEIAEKFDIVTHDRHSAIGDSMITALAFLKLLKKLGKKDVNTLKKLCQQFR